MLLTGVKLHVILSKQNSQSSIVQTSLEHTTMLNILVRYNLFIPVLPEIWKLYFAMERKLFFINDS